MTILQTTAVYLIIGTFVFIAGREMYSRYLEMETIRKARHKKLLENIEKGDII